MFDIQRTIGQPLLSVVELRRFSTEARGDVKTSPIIKDDSMIIHIVCCITD